MCKFKPNHSMPRALPLAATLLLSACVGTPPVPEPAVAVPDQWQSEAGASRQAPASQTWWRDLGSTELSGLVEQALVANRDLQIATVRVAQARALVGEADSDRLPQLSATAGASKGRQTILDAKASVKRAGFVASWEADVFGQKGLASRAARLDAQAAELVRQGAQTVVAAEVATAYLDAAVLNQREILGRSRLAVLAQAVDAAQKQFVAGQASRVDIDRRLAAQQSYRAELEQLRGVLRQRLLQLAVLLGATPGSVQPAFADYDAIHGAAPAPWLPGELLERRPDVQRQARNLSAAAARVGIAKLDLYPKFVFSWANARENARIDGQSAATDIALGYGISLSLPIFDGGRLRSRIEVSEAQLTEAMAAYEKSMLDALADAELVLVRQQASAGSLAELKRAVATTEAVAGNAQRLFSAGLADRGAVLDSQQALLQATDALLQARGAYWVAGVDVYRAFSGKVDGDR